MKAVLGFTGSRKGMNGNQKSKLMEYLDPARVCELHHGDCIGADVEAFELAKEFGIKTVSHPPTDNKYRAFTDSDVVLPPKPYLARNRDIVEASDAVVGMPKYAEGKGSRGTWYTINYSREWGNFGMWSLP